MTALRIGSLFSGIGGLDLGVEHATGGRTVWQVEADEWCRGVLARHWPDARRYDDVCAVGEELEHVDIIAGGFPCQDVSLAGKRAGLEGQRSGLWREFARIIRMVRPRLVFVENVSGLLSLGLGDVLGDLAALGFDAEWSVFRASDVGAPHRRERVFILAVANGAGVDGQWGESIGGRVRRSTRSAGVCGCSKGMADDCGRCRDQRSALGHDIGGRDRTASVGVEFDLDDTNGARRRAPAAGEVRARRNASLGAGEELAVAVRDGSLSGNAAAPARRATAECGRAQGRGVDGGVAAQPGVGGVAHGLSARLDAHRWPSRPSEAQHKWEAPRVAQGIPERRQRLKALGNAVVPQQAALAWRVLSERFAAGGAR